MNEKIFMIGDLHIPFEDVDVVKKVLKCIRHEKPHKIILMGDVVDFYDVSTYDKNPARVKHLQDEIDYLHIFLDDLKKASPRSEIHYLKGNHEDRLRRYLIRNPELHSLRNLKIPKILGLDEYDVKYHEHNYVYKGFLFTHGDIIRAHSGYTAKAMMEKKGMNGLMGHTHRLATYYKTDLTGTKTFMENGCLCDLTPEYVADPNWQQGFTLLHFKDKSKRFHAIQVPITGGKFLLNGRYY